MRVDSIKKKVYALLFLKQSLHVLGIKLLTTSGTWILEKLPWYLHGTYHTVFVCSPIKLNQPSLCEFALVCASGFLCACARTTIENTRQKGKKGNQKTQRKNRKEGEKKIGKIEREERDVITTRPLQRFVNLGHTLQP